MPWLSGHHLPDICADRVLLNRQGQRVKEHSCKDVAALTCVGRWPRPPHATPERPSQGSCRAAIRGPGRMGPSCARGRAPDGWSHASQPVSLAVSPGRWPQIKHSPVKPCGSPELLMWAQVRAVVGVGLGTSLCSSGSVGCLELLIGLMFSVPGTDGT